jgi:hypothetical protein
MSNADTPTETKSADPARVIPALHPRFFNAAEHVRAIYTATIPAGIEPKDLVSPAFWSHISANLRPWDRIECIAEDGAYFVELLVLSATQTDANVVQLNHKKLDRVQAGEADLLKDFEVSHTPATNWRVLRKKDRREVATGLKSRSEAITWLATNQRAA